MMRGIRVLLAIAVWLVVHYPIASKAQHCPSCRHEWARDATPESVAQMFANGVSPNGYSAFQSPLLFLIGMVNSDPNVARAFVDEAKRRHVELNLVKRHRSGYVQDTILHNAARNRSVAMVKYFLALGADPMLRDDRDKTPLQSAPGYSEEPLVYKALLAAGTDPNAQDNLGWTVMHSAALFSKKPEIFRILTMHGGDINARTDNGLTPLVIAQRHRESDIVELLRSLGAK